LVEHVTTLEGRVMWREISIKRGKSRNVRWGEKEGKCVGGPANASTSIEICLTRDEKKKGGLGIPKKSDCIRSGRTNIE